MIKRTMIVSVMLLGAAIVSAQTKVSKKKIELLKNEVAELVQSNSKLSQEMVDMIFSFGELGFQEYETSAYITGILEENGFKYNEVFRE